MSWPFMWRADHERAIDKLKTEVAGYVKGLAERNAAYRELDARYAAVATREHEATEDFRRQITTQKAAYQQAVNDLAARLTAAETRYHDLVLKMTTAPTARIEDAKPDAEERAMHAVSTASKMRLAEHLVEEAKKRGMTIDLEQAFIEATQYFDHPEGILLAG